MKIFVLIYALLVFSLLEEPAVPLTSEATCLKAGGSCNAGFCVFPSSREGHCGNPETWCCITTVLLKSEATCHNAGGRCSAGFCTIEEDREGYCGNPEIWCCIQSGSIAKFIAHP